jgi:hypothetical protein
MILAGRFLKGTNKARSRHRFRPDKAGNGVFLGIRFKLLHVFPGMTGEYVMTHGNFHCVGTHTFVLSDQISSIVFLRDTHPLTSTRSCRYANNSRTFYWRNLKGRRAISGGGGRSHVFMISTYHVSYQCNFTDTNMNIHYIHVFLLEFVLLVHFIVVHCHNIRPAPPNMVVRLPCQQTVYPTSSHVSNP